MASFLISVSHINFSSVTGCPPPTLCGQTRSRRRAGRAGATVAEDLNDEGPAGDPLPTPKKDGYILEGDGGVRLCPRTACGISHIRRTEKGRPATHAKFSNECRTV